MTLGILDWGIGGVGFFAAFKARFPDVGVVYLSDTGSTPYGRQSARDLEARLAFVAPRLAQAGVTRLVVACNAMSTVLPRHSDGELGLECIRGVIGSAVEAVLEADVGVVGVVGGTRTIRSGAYRRPLRAAGLVVRQRVAQPLSALVEAGLVGSPAFRAGAERVMAPLARVDALVLGCTHYWAGAPRFRELTQAAVIVDPARETLDRVVSGWFVSRPADGDGRGGDGRGGVARRDGGGRAGVVRRDGARAPDAAVVDSFFTTGDPAAMTRAALLAFGVTLPPVVGIGPDLRGLA
jgi:glutamate racemase